MTFTEPGRLLLLLAPVALLVAYVVAQRSRQRAALRFSSVELLASVAPRRSGWQRHLPAAALLAAIAVLALAVAGPAMVVRQTRERAIVVLSLDTSPSMTSADVPPSRLAAAQEEARRFVRELPEGFEVGLVQFAERAYVLVTPTGDRTAVLAAIDSLQVFPGTATGEGINLSLAAIAALPEASRNAPAAIVLMSDGTPTVSGRGDLSPQQAADEAAENAKDAGIPVNTIAFGTPDGTAIVNGETARVPVDPVAMKKIADTTGGRTFTAETAGELKSVYDEIGRDIVYVESKRDITAAFTAAALVVAVLAAIGALIWTQRVI